MLKDVSTENQSGGENNSTTQEGTRSDDTDVCQTISGPSLKNRKEKRSPPKELFVEKALKQSSKGKESESLPPSVVQDTVNSNTLSSSNETTDANGASVSKQRSVPSASSKDKFLKVQHSISSRKPKIIPKRRIRRDDAVTSSLNEPSNSDEPNPMEASKVNNKSNKASSSMSNQEDLVMNELGTKVNNIISKELEVKQPRKGKIKVKRKVNPNKNASTPEKEIM